MLLPGSQPLLALHHAALPQRDELCGAFWGSLALAAAGVAEVDQQAVAAAAGTRRSADPRASLPPGEIGRAITDPAIARAASPDEAGTSASGLARAIEFHGAGAVATVPASGTWTAEAVTELLEDLSAWRSPVTAIANIRTGLLWGSRPPIRHLLGYLDTGTAEPVGPEWDVGHFVALVGLIPGDGGRLVLVADTYRSLGADAVHAQPVERVAEALAREGWAPGGLLLVVAADARDDAEETVRRAGLSPDLWDNGTPDPHARNPVTGERGVAT
ncbi:DUF6885 family protein [Egibacter rhizosphaerae]